MKVLVLCHGNVNRSPLCAAVLAQHSGITVKQAGVNLKLRPGVAAKKMREAAAKYDIDLSDHRSQAITPELYSWADIIIDMDGGNRKRLLQFKQDNMLAKKKMVNLGEWANPKTTRIQDPAFLKKGDPKMDEIVRQIIDATMNFGIAYDNVPY